MADELGHPIRGSVVDEVAETLQAAFADRAAADAVRSARLVRGLEAVGTEVDLEGAVAGGAPAKRERARGEASATPRPKSGTKRDDGRDEVARKRAERAAREADEHADRAESDLDEADRRLEEARGAVAQAAEARDALEQRIRKLEAPSSTSRLPLALQRYFYARAVKASQGDMEAYGLPTPDHKLLEAHPTVSSDLCASIGHGRVTVKPNIERFEGDRVRFTDGTTEAIDTIVYCTGYKISFPFFPVDMISAPDNRIPLYRRVVDPEHPGLYFIGLIQPLGAIMPIAKLQCEWVADILEGKVQLPSRAVMREVIRREDERMAERYVRSPRHTIQVDFYPYIRTLRRERKRVRRGGLTGLLARRSHELRLER